MSQAVEEMARAGSAAGVVQERQAKARQRTLERLTYYSVRLEGIGQRLDELEREWNLDRAVQTGTGTVALLSIFWYAATRTRFCLLVASVANVWLLVQAFTGWSAPGAILRRAGLRTQTEIDSERYALKALRGDFQALPREGDPVSRTEQALRIVAGDGRIA